MSKGVNYVFDANQHEPDAGFELVPADNYNVQVSSTDLKLGDSNEPQAFVVGFDIIDGAYAGRKIFNRYSLWSQEPQANKISHGQLSALSHVTGIYQIDMNTVGAALHGARLKVRVSNDGKYNNIKEVFDINGNKPQRAGHGSAPVAPAPQAAPGGYAPQAAPAYVAAPAQFAPQPAVAPVGNFAPAGYAPAPQVHTAPVAGTFNPPQTAPAAFGGGQPAPAAVNPPPAVNNWNQAAPAPQAAPGQPPVAPWGAPAA